jgi:hypothetical protein
MMEFWEILVFLCAWTVIIYIAIGCAVGIIWPYFVFFQ